MTVLGTKSPVWIKRPIPAVLSGAPLGSANLELHILSPPLPCSLGEVGSFQL
jgi:hypothetical protein